MVVEIDERRKLVEGDASVALGVDLFNQRSHLVLRYLPSRIVGWQVQVGKGN